MDDLDHSVHIAERDWESFYEESEECCLLQPALAGLEDSILSDSEDSESPEHFVLDSGDHPRTPQSNPNDEGSRGAEEGYTVLPLQPCLRSPRESQPEYPHETPEEAGALLKMSEILNISPESQRPSDSTKNHLQENTVTRKLVRAKSAEQDTEVLNESQTSDHTFREQYVMAEPVNDEPSASGSSNSPDGTSSGFPTSVLTDLQTQDKQREGETSGAFSSGSISQLASPHCKHEELNMNQPCCPDKAACERDSREAPKGEKERWFVTVNDSPQRQRPHAVPVAPKKTRKKKRYGSSVDRASTSELTDHPNESGPETGKDRVYESEGEDMEQLMKSDRNSTAQPTTSMCTVFLHGEPDSDLKQISKNSLIFQDVIFSELPFETIDASKTLPTPSTDCEKNGLADSPEQTVTHEALAMHNEIFTHGDEKAPQMDSTDIEDLKDKLFSTASFDWEEYVLAPDSTEDPQQLHHEVQCNLSLMTQNVASGSYLTQQITEANLQSSIEKELQQQHECYENSSDEAYTEPTEILPCTSRSKHLLPTDSPSTCDSQHSSLSDTWMEKTAHEDRSPTDCEHLAQANIVTDTSGSPSPSPPAVTVTPCSLPESPETLTTLGPTRPVYAISTFWDEMEKLTINDILQLRINRGPSPMREIHNLQAMAGEQVNIIDTHVQHNPLADTTTEYLLTDGTLVDPSDGADSDYFTHIDDSKPDRSSCEFSTFSDFDEEYMQFIGASSNPSPEPQDLKLSSQMSTEFPYLNESLREEDMDPLGQENHVNDEHQTVQDFEDCTPNSLFTDNDTFLKGLTKSKSMRNVQAFEMETQLKDISLHSIFEQVERCFVQSPVQVFEDSPFFEGNGKITSRTRTPSPVLPSTDIIYDPHQISFPEVFEYLFEDDEPKGNSTTLIYDSQRISETSDYSLSKYGSEIFSPPQLSMCSEGEPVPIFSCSRSTPRDLTFPELDDLIFPHDTNIESEGEDDCSPIRVVTRNDIKSKHTTDKHGAATTVSPDSYQHLFSMECWQKDWKRLFSLRRIRFPGRGSSWCRRSGAWVFPPASHISFTPSIQTRHQAIELGNETRINSMPPQVIQLGQQIFRELLEQQRRLTAVSITNRDGLLYTLKQSDMCLVCIAFASWVLKSTDPLAVDAWKAALLANVSAISAIQYLRRYMRRKPNEEEP